MPSHITSNSASGLEKSGKLASPSKEKHFDVDRPLSASDVNSVRNRILKWQEQTGAISIVGVPCYSADQGENSSEPKPKSRPPKDKRDAALATRPRTREHSKNAPKKRVISDEHWKLNRSSGKSSTASPKLPIPNRIGEYTTNDQFKTFEEKKNIRGSEQQECSSSDNGSRGHVTHGRRSSKSPKSMTGESDTRNDALSLHTAFRLATKSIATADAEYVHRTAGRLPRLWSDAEYAVGEADSELSKRRTQEPSQKSSAGDIFTHTYDGSRATLSGDEQDSLALIQLSQSRGTETGSWPNNAQDSFGDELYENISIPLPLNTRAKKGKRCHQHDGERRCAAELQELSCAERGSVKGQKLTKRKRLLSGREQRESRKDSKGKGPLRTRELFIVSPLDGNSEVDDDGLSDKFDGDGFMAASQKKMRQFNEERSPGLNAADIPEGIEADAEILTAHDEKQPEEAVQNTSAETLLTSQNDLTRGSHGNIDTKCITDPSQLGRKLTTHDDLISVLSARHSRGGRVRSARSVRTNNSRLSKVTVTDLLEQMCVDEATYMRELKTLVGGVIPVLLTCILSKSDSAIAAGLFRPSADPRDETSFSKPIVDMGIAIERLKAIHKRIPRDKVQSLLLWAQGAERVYRQYLRSWRLGFKDVVVNLAPLEKEEANSDAETKSLDEGLDRDESGDVVDSYGEKVDVAYLLKRPLVRLKYLAKTFKGISILEPSPKATEIAAAYQALVTDARRRVRDERARLEDESAAMIDATRSRDPMTLGVLTGITINKSRLVRARDFFNLTLYHSSGQMIDCSAELLLRANVTGDCSDGDLLICEIDHSDRWLLFPPINLGCVSARSGDQENEIVIMLRSAPGEAESWQELLSLRPDEEEVGSEWVQLLGLDPVPPSIHRSQSFAERAKRRQPDKIIPDKSDNLCLAGSLSSHGIDIPIGEKAILSHEGGPLAVRCTPPEQDPAENPPMARPRTAPTVSQDSFHTEKEPEAMSICEPQQPGPVRTGNNGERSAVSLKRSPAKRIPRHGEATPPAGSAPKPTSDTDMASLPDTPRYYVDNQDMNQLLNSTGNPTAEKQQYMETPREDAAKPSPRLSTTPPLSLPIIPRIRQKGSLGYSSQLLASESDEKCMEDDQLADEPDSSSMDVKYVHSELDMNKADVEEPPPPPPPHSVPSSAEIVTDMPILSPGHTRPKRRGSSPLKHEYEPSTASDSCSNSDNSTVRRYNIDSEFETSVTDTSDEETESELVALTDIRGLSKALPGEQIYTSPATSSLSPSNSASQSGYRSVPVLPSKSTHVNAFVFVWSDKGSWDSIFPGECNVVVGPGLIEAYETKVTLLDFNELGANGEGPLIALELTPLVPIRRSTAIDISIRSPPTKRSKIISSSNVMLRSRSPDECEILYNLINQARTNNPTYIALQNARGPFISQFPEDKPSNKTRRWLGWPRRSKSYRASSGQRSLAGNSESSVGTMSSAFSALKQFGAGSKMFNIARSSITSRSERGGSYHRSMSTKPASDHFKSSNISRACAAVKNSDEIGLSRAKIRLYVRETQTKWRDMGAARLSIFPVPLHAGHLGTLASGSSDSGRGSATSDKCPDASLSISGTEDIPRHHSDIGSMKRILIRGKTRGEVLLDTCLGETSFERVARTGIAVSVWEENEGGVAKEGGVGRGLFKVYMIQMKNEAEATYTFGLVGKLRY